MDNKEVFRSVRSAIRQGATQEALSILRQDDTRLTMMTPFGSWLHVAASFGNLELVRALVSLGADVNRRGGIMDAGPIEEAASNGHVEVVRFLLEKGAVLDVSESTRNPFFSAILGGHLDVVRVLVDAGIDHRIRYTGKSMKNTDAVAFARERGQLDIAAFLADA